jgi:hypothetical protein
VVCSWHEQTIFCRKCLIEDDLRMAVKWFAHGREGVRRSGLKFAQQRRLRKACAIFVLPQALCAKQLAILILKIAQNKGSVRRFDQPTRFDQGMIKPRFGASVLLRATYDSHFEV